MTNAPSTTSAPAPTASAPGALASALLRSFGVASAIVLLAAAVAGGVVFGALAALPADALPYDGAGVVAALLASMVTLVLHGRFLDPRTTAPFANDGRLAGARLQSLLAAAFVVKLVVLVAGVLVLRQAGTKFSDAATFAVTFAGGALLCQVATATCLARALPQRRPAAPGMPPAFPPA